MGALPRTALPHPGRSEPDRRRAVGNGGGHPSVAPLRTSPTAHMPGWLVSSAERRHDFSAAGTWLADDKALPWRARDEHHQGG